MSRAETRSLVLRLAGPMQSWGTTSQFNRRTTADRPSKSGVVGLLAAAQGRQRGEHIDDLADLAMAVRVDQPGRVLRDFHTASMLDGSPLPSTSVNAHGLQKKTTPAKATYVTTRDYLTDAVFVVIVRAPADVAAGLAAAVKTPRYPLALGRRSCPPAQPLLVPSGEEPLWTGSLDEVLRSVPWQAGEAARRARGLGSTVSLSATIDDPVGGEVLADVPVSFAQQQRGFASRRVRHSWVDVPTGLDGAAVEHDPFAMLGW